MANLSSLEDIVRAHQKICDEEKKLEKQINDLLDYEVKLAEDMKIICKKVPNLQWLSSDAQKLSNMINFTSNLASDVSYKVKQLDLVKNRVNQCLQRVGDILDLKYCTQNIEEALNNDDYEVASVNIHRFLSIDESVIRKSANGTINGQVLGGSSMDEAFAKLHEAEDKLKTLVMRKFDEAVQENDVASVERFFKIFPLLNQKDDGLRKFSNYLCNKICQPPGPDQQQSLNCDDTSVNHVTQLTSLFEIIAKIIDVHTPLFETYYGPGNLIYCVEILQRECDRKSKKILDDFVTKKSLSTILSNVQKSSKSNSSISVTKVDPRDIDPLLNEMAMINSRSETYLKFIRERTRKDIEASANDDNDKLTLEEKLKRAEDLIRNCMLSHMLQELNGTYVLLEDYFARESCIKAIQMDDIDSSSSTSSLTSSMLDDVFFIIKKSITRALSSGSLDVLCATINHSVSILETFFCDSINERIKYGYPNAGGISGAAAALDLSQAYNAIQTGRYLQTYGDIEKAKLVFLSSLNNLDTACDYIRSLKNNVHDQVVKSSIFVEKPPQKDKLESCLTDLIGLTNKFQSLIHSGLNQIFISLIKPRIRSWLDAFTSESHLLSEDEIMKFEATDGLRPFTQTFLINLDSILKTMKNGFTSNNYKNLINLLSTELTKRLETAIFKCNLNKLGGYQFDREIRAIINYISSTTNWPIRDKFSRLKQIAVILNFESINEALDYFNLNNDGFRNNSASNMITFMLTPNEVRQILKLRADFTPEDLRKIKL